MGGPSVERGLRAAAESEGSAVVCPKFHAAVELIGRRWAGAILFKLIEGPHYFRELLGAVPGISDRLLSQRLRELEAEGLVERSVHEGPPARVSYCLSPAGEDLIPALRKIHEWAQDHDVKGAKPDGVDKAA
jgi:DNA-binding HxlR family transcriptional regulator